MAERFPTRICGVTLDLIALFDLFGVFVFAISGALAAVRKDMDIFGVTMIALFPAVGGGTLRDIILDVPVFWVVDTTPVWVTFAAAVISFFLSPLLESRLRVLIWADAFGLALFAVLGAGKALDATGSVLIAVMMGVATGVVGGMIRDVVCNDLPLVLRREIYATAACAGAGTFCLLRGLNVQEDISLWVSVAGAFAVRAAGILLGLSLPRPPR